MPIEDIADLVGYSGTSVTEKVYRRQLRPVLLKGAAAIDLIFPADRPRPACSHPVSYSETMRGHAHGWDMASDLVGDTCRNKNRVCTVEGPSVTVTAVGARLPRE
jgi:hypothetical protein